MRGQGVGDPFSIHTATLPHAAHLPHQQWMILASYGLRVSLPGSATPSMLSR